MYMARVIQTRSPEELRQRQAGYDRKHRLKKYGLTPEALDAMLESQGGVCAVCGTSEWKGHGSAPHVDHDHTSGAVRGLLCVNCNRGLGFFGDDVARLRSAIVYLETFTKI